MNSSAQLGRMVERIVAALLLICLLPIFFVLSVAIKLDSNGPVLFRQTRVGKDEVTFGMWKFRSMRPDAHHKHHKLLKSQLDAGSSFLVKQVNDNRVTRLGRLLRKSSLDELPQLINVVDGSMSFVGPRPMLPEEVAFLSRGDRRRFTALPGITGLAQVNGRGLLAPKEYIEYDLMLIENHSVGLYFRVLFKTLGAVISQRGAV